MAVQEIKISIAVMLPCRTTPQSNVDFDYSSTEFLGDAKWQEFYANLRR